MDNQLNNQQSTICNFTSPSMSPYNVRVEQLGSIPLAVIRSTACPNELSRVVPQQCGLVWNALRAQQIRGGRHVAVYWDAAITLEVGVEVSVPFVERDGVVRSATPAGIVASMVHLGRYERLGDAHQAIHAWSKAANRRLAGPKWEIYDHWKQQWDNDPSQIRTDVFYLVSPE
jgi:effector-binding domain-containing protein